MKKIKKILDGKPDILDKEEYIQWKKSKVWISQKVPERIDVAKRGLEKSGESIGSKKRWIWILDSILLMIAIFVFFMHGSGREMLFDFFESKKNEFNEIGVQEQDDFISFSKKKFRDDGFFRYSWKVKNKRNNWKLIFNVENLSSQKKMIRRNYQLDVWVYLSSQKHVKALSKTIYVSNTLKSKQNIDLFSIDRSSSKKKIMHLVRSLFICVNDMKFHISLVNEKN